LEGGLGSVLRQNHLPAESFFLMFLFLDFRIFSCGGLEGGLGSVLRQNHLPAESFFLMFLFLDFRIFSCGGLLLTIDFSEDPKILACNQSKIGDISESIERDNSYVFIS